MNVSFTDQSTGAPSSWAWDFQNDGVVDSNAQNPSFQYTAPGSYSVKLTVANGAGSNSRTETGYITVSPGGGSTSVTYTPTDDAYVRSNFPDENTGTAPTLRAYKSSTAQTDSFLRFAVGAPAGSISSVKLRLFVRDASPNGGVLFTADPNWSESALTWNTRPTIGTTTIASAGAVTVGTWIELDVTSHRHRPGPIQLRPPRRLRRRRLLRHRRSRQQATARRDLRLTALDPLTRELVCDDGLAAAACCTGRAGLGMDEARRPTGDR